MSIAAIERKFKALDIRQKRTVKRFDSSEGRLRRVSGQRIDIQVANLRSKRREEALARHQQWTSPTPQNLKELTANNTPLITHQDVRSVLTNAILAGAYAVEELEDDTFIKEDDEISNTSDGQAFAENVARSSANTTLASGYIQSAVSLTFHPQKSSRPQTAPARRTNANQPRPHTAHASADRQQLAHGISGASLLTVQPQFQRVAFQNKTSASTTQPAQASSGSPVDIVPPKDFLGGVWTLDQWSKPPPRDPMQVRWASSVGLEGAAILTGRLTQEQQERRQHLLLTSAGRFSRHQSTPNLKLIVKKHAPSTSVGGGKSNGHSFLESRAFGSENEENDEWKDTFNELPATPSPPKDFRRAAHADDQNVLQSNGRTAVDEGYTASQQSVLQPLDSQHSTEALEDAFSHSLQDDDTEFRAEQSDIFAEKVKTLLQPAVKVPPLKGLPGTEDYGHDYVSQECENNLSSRSLQAEEQQTAKLGARELTSYQLHRFENELQRRNNEAVVDGESKISRPQPVIVKPAPNIFDAAFYYLRVKVSHPELETLGNWRFDVFFTDITEAKRYTHVFRNVRLNAYGYVVFEEPNGVIVDPVKSFRWVARPVQLYKHSFRIQVYGIRPVLTRVLNQFVYFGQGSMDVPTAATEGAIEQTTSTPITKATAASSSEPHAEEFERTICFDMSAKEQKQHNLDIHSATKPSPKPKNLLPSTAKRRQRRGRPLSAKSVSAVMPSFVDLIANIDSPQRKQPRVRPKSAVARLSSGDRELDQEWLKRLHMVQKDDANMSVLGSKSDLSPNNKSSAATPTSKRPASANQSVRDTDTTPSKRKIHVDLLNSKSSLISVDNNHSLARSGLPTRPQSAAVREATRSTQEHSNMLRSFWDPQQSKQKEMSDLKEKYNSASNGVRGEKNTAAALKTFAAVGPRHRPMSASGPRISKGRQIIAQETEKRRSSVQAAAVHSGIPQKLSLFGVGQSFKDILPSRSFSSQLFSFAPNFQEERAAIIKSKTQKRKANEKQSKGLSLSGMKITLEDNPLNTSLSGLTTNLPMPYQNTTDKRDNNTDSRRNLVTTPSSPSLQDDITLRTASASATSSSVTRVYQGRPNGKPSLKIIAPSVVYSDEISTPIPTPTASSPSGQVGGHANDGVSAWPVLSVLASRPH